MFYLGITEQKNMKGKRGLDRYELNDSGFKTLKLTNRTVQKRNARFSARW